MGDSSYSWVKSGDHTDMVELTGKVMVVAIILLIFVVIFFFCLHLYFKWFYHHRVQAQTPTITIRPRRRRRRLDFAAGHQEIVVVPSSRIGLEPCVLKSIPVVEFNPNAFKDGLECAVCLCEVCEGENARILPNCNHGFHVECIDMWFQSHATCPLCRNPVSNQKPSNSDQDYSSSSEGPNLPTNVLFWGDETQVNPFGPCMEELDHLASPLADQSSTSSTASASASTSSCPEAGMVVIDIPVLSANS